MEARQSLLDGKLDSSNPLTNAHESLCMSGLVHVSFLCAQCFFLCRMLCVLGCDACTISLSLSDCTLDFDKGGSFIAPTHRQLPSSRIHSPSTNA